MRKRLVFALAATAGGALVPMASLEWKRDAELVVPRLVSATWIATYWRAFAQFLM